MEGVLSLHGVEKPVVLNVEYGGEVRDSWKNIKAGFTAAAKLNRKDFGIIYNQILEAGGLALGDRVEISLEIEALKSP